ncbi:MULTISPECIES: Lmo0850 family protein [Bacillaceae]|uniref:Lmo0850 family protein n=1 Tax=Rossellomorea oryzaecorticis TaxID=1396505 RepID=A0ABW8VUQ4_9BACI|nr:MULTISPECIES: Lmo0850 family protein [Bacillaceae]
MNNVVKENDRFKKVITKLSNVGVNISKTKSRREILHSLKQYQPLPKTLTQDS